MNTDTRGFLYGCGWWGTAGLLQQVFILRPLLSHSRLTWACGANWLLIACLYTGPSPHAETSSFKGNQLNEIIYQSRGLSRHPNTQPPPSHLPMQPSPPPPLPAVLQAFRDSPPGKNYLQKECMLSSHHHGFTQLFPPTASFLRRRKPRIWKRIKAIKRTLDVFIISCQFTVCSMVTMRIILQHLDNTMVHTQHSGLFNLNLPSTAFPSLVSNGL